MHGSTFCTSLDKAQVYHKLELEDSDKHKTAFLDATGRFVEFTVCSFGLTTIPATYTPRTWEMT